MRLLNLTSPIKIRRVRGGSMQPTLYDGMLVVFTTLLRPRDKSVVLFVDSFGNEYVKRLYITTGEWNLFGDNSSDSQDFYRVSPESVQATLLFGKAKRKT